MVAPLECLEIERWQTLLDLSHSPEQQQRLERHLESCPVCQDRIDRPEEGDETLRQLARQTGDPTVLPADTGLEQFLERLLQEKGEQRATAAEPLELFFLQATDRPDLLGMLGPYEVQEVIGQGGMGVVLQAFDPVLRRRVAIKVMAAAVAGSRTARQRFTREAQAAAVVSHEHIVAIHGVHETEGLPYLVMQYVAGESLQALLDRNGPLPTAEVVRIGLQVASGLAAAHARGLIHRDIKPANLLLEAGIDRVKITDFGLARLIDDAPLTHNGVVAGTPEYMAPEQARGEPVDHRADLFSLGSVLYALCTGVPPFRGATPLAVLRQVSEQDPVPIRLLNPDVPAWLEAFITRLLAKNPAQRFQSAAEVAGCLEGYLAHLHQPEIPAPEWLAAQQSRWPGRFLPLAVLALLGLGTAFWFAGAAGQTDSRAMAEPGYSWSLKGDQPQDKRGLEIFPVEAEEYFRFEPEGLRVSFPLGFPKRRGGNVGLITTFPIKGDFEITVRFEILKEPDPADTVLGGTGLGLVIKLDKPHDENVALNRTVLPKQGSRFTTYQYKWVDGKDRSTLQQFPTSAKTGQMRLIRTGQLLSYQVAEEASNEFTVLHEQAFGTEDLKQVRLTGFTGGPKAAVEGRFTDLRIRAPSLPDLAPVEPEKVRGARWLLAVGLLLVVVALIVGAGLYLRERQRRPQ